MPPEFAAEVALFVLFCPQLLSASAPMFRLLRPNQWFLLIAAYFAAQTALRVFSTVDVAPTPATGSFLFDATLGALRYALVSTRLADAVFHNAMLFLTFACVYQTVRRFGRSDWAMVCALSLFFVPQIVWVGQHAGDVETLSTLLAAASLWSFAWLYDQRNLVAFGMFGAVIALAALTSLEALFVPAVLLLAALTHTEGWRLFYNWRTNILVLVAVGWSGPQWAVLLAHYGAARDVVFDASVLHPDALHAVAQSTLAFAGFLFVGMGLLFHVGLGARPYVELRYLYFRQILARHVALGFLALLAWFGIAGTDELTFAMIRPFLICLIPLGGVYLVPLMSDHMRITAVRGAVLAAVIILFASPTQYNDMSHGLTAWYLEFRASEGARTPLL